MNQTCTKIQGGIWTENRGKFRGSARRGILVIIYMDDVVVDIGSIGRRSELPIRIVPDIPRDQAGEMIRGTTNNAGGRHERLQEREITSTIKTRIAPPEQKQKPGTKDETTKKEQRCRRNDENAETPNGAQDLQHITPLRPAQNRQIEDARTILLKTYIWAPTWNGKDKTSGNGRSAEKHPESRKTRTSSYATTLGMQTTPRYSSNQTPMYKCVKEWEITT